MSSEVISVESGGTQGECRVPAGERLIGFEFPTLDSTTVAVHLSRNGTTYRVASDAAGDAITVAGTTTGDEFVAVSDALSRLSLGASQLRLVLGSAQSGGARTITALFAAGGVG